MVKARFDTKEKEKRTYAAYPMLPPMTRMERVNAETVAIRSSGQMMVVMI
jgi:hypothetical protein